MKTKLMLSAVVVSMMALSACGPQAFVKGQYDDVDRENNLNDQWSETDMQKAVHDLVASALNSPSLSQAKKMPVVMVTNLQNKTSEHIDTQSIMDMVRVELMKSGRVGFIDKEAREDISSEYDYQNSGKVSKETAKGPGGQIGADYIINGRLDSIVQEVGKDKSVYYKLTLNLTNLKTSMISWSDQKQIRKTYKKKTIGL
ncbi:MAG TPA: penicillin-binding protein activator LpoB [Bdellovibrio sp.]|uniref:penicillin-binding protein activator LpoB n=1 Tax=Bdellovibrio sp. TaxID=28201 RepID=UPI002F027697